MYQQIPLCQIKSVLNHPKLAQTETRFCINQVSFYMSFGASFLMFKLITYNIPHMQRFCQPYIASLTTEYTALLDPVT